MQHFISKLVLTALILCVFQNNYSQQFNFQSPIDFPIFLSGNFGELRGTHFHAGIDIKTQGETGKNIHALADGYVSRAKIQSEGYGHAVYITHPNGYTTVYGHLNYFFPELEEYIKNLQYTKKSFEVDQYFEPDQFRVSQGQVIGISGNTGYSGGPHLHLEIRNKNQVPVNGLKFGFPIQDTISPKFRNLIVYEDFDSDTYSWDDKKIIPVHIESNVYKPDNTIVSRGNVAFGVEVYDYLNGSANRCGVYSLDFYANDKLLYSMKIDKVGYGEMRYIKSYCDYEEKKLNGRNVHRLFIEPNNKLRIYNRTFSSTSILPVDSLIYNCKVVATDAYNNKSELDFKVQTLNSERESQLMENTSVYFRYDSKNDIEMNNFKFEVPEDALFSNQYVKLDSIPSDSNFYSPFYIIGNELVPLIRYPELSIKVQPKVNINRLDKLVIARYDTSGEIISEGGRWQNGWVTAKVNGFGKYAVIADTVNPEIIPVSFKNKGWYAPDDRLVFKIRDELSGIKTYNGYIDDNWVLFEYDAKSDNLFYRIDETRLERTKSIHELKIYVMDERNNISIYKGEFYF